MSEDRFFRLPNPSEPLFEPLIIEVQDTSNNLDELSGSKIELPVESEDVSPLFSSASDNNSNLVNHSNTSEGKIDVPVVSTKRKSFIGVGLFVVTLATIHSCVNGSDSGPNNYVSGSAIELTLPTSTDSNSKEQIKVSEIGFTDPAETTTSTTTSTTTAPTTAPTTTSTTAPTTIAEIVAPPVAVETTDVGVTTEVVLPIDEYEKLDCKQTSETIETGWTISEIANKCNISVGLLKSYNPQINDFNKIIVGSRINLSKPVSSSSNSTNTSTASAPKIECAAIGGTIKPLQSGFTIESYLKNLGYSNNQALFLAYETSLLSDYGLSGKLIAGNDYCLPTTNGIEIRYGV
jgi:hypothetical protein